MRQFVQRCTRVQRRQQTIRIKLRECQIPNEISVTYEVLDHRMTAKIIVLTERYAIKIRVRVKKSKSWHFMFRRISLLEVLQSKQKYVSNEIRAGKDNGFTHEEDNIANRKESTVQIALRHNT